jgi:hypothetical protein
LNNFQESAIIAAYEALVTVYKINLPAVIEQKLFDAKEGLKEAFPDLLTDISYEIDKESSEEADSFALKSAGFGTDEDYGIFD